MEALKLKIFDVLTERISVLEFENWLYKSKEFLDGISSNTFYLYIISINYRSRDWPFKLNNLAKEYLEGDCLEIWGIKKVSLGIIKSETFDETHEILNALMKDFNYETDYSILWKFNQLNDYFGLVKDGIYKSGTLQIEAKFYAKQTIEIISSFENINELKNSLELELKPFKSSKIGRKETLKQKILAFFKKI